MQENFCSYHKNLKQETEKFTEKSCSAFTVSTVHVSFLFVSTNLANLVPLLNFCIIGRCLCLVVWHVWCGEGSCDWRLSCLHHLHDHLLLLLLLLSLLLQVQPTEQPEGDRRTASCCWPFYRFNQHQRRFSYAAAGPKNLRHYALCRSQSRAQSINSSLCIQSYIHRFWSRGCASDQCERECFVRLVWRLSRRKE